MSELEDILRPIWSDEEDLKLKEGIRLYEQKDYNKAIDVLTSLLNTLPTSARGPEARAHKHLAFCYEALGQTPRGLQELKLAVECFPHDELVSDGQKDRREIYELQIEIYLQEHPELKTENL